MRKIDISVEEAINIPTHLRLTIGQVFMLHTMCASVMEDNPTPSARALAMTIHAKLGELVDLESIYKSLMVEEVL